MLEYGKSTRMVRIGKKIIAIIVGVLITTIGVLLILSLINNKAGEQILVFKDSITIE